MSQTTEPSPNWLREPLIHFVVLAGLLFLIDYLSTQAQKDQIVVSKVTVDFLIEQREDLELRTLSPQERQATVDQYIDDEILYSEAYKRGFDRGDSRMRRNLILKMRGLLAGEIGDPTEQELRTFYESNRERFLYNETWDLDQVFFSDPAAIPEGVLTLLRDGTDPLTLGENRFDLRRSMPAATQRGLVGIFGPDSARKILAFDDDQWRGPLESPIGAHFVRVTHHTAAIEPPFENIEPYLEGEWRMAQTRQRIEQELEGLRGDYDVVIESADSGS